MLWSCDHSTFQIASFFAPSLQLMVRQLYGVEQQASMRKPENPWVAAHDLQPRNLSLEGWQKETKQKNQSDGWACGYCGRRIPIPKMEQSGRSLLVQQPEGRYSTGAGGSDQIGGFQKWLSRDRIRQLGWWWNWFRYRIRQLGWFWIRQRCFSRNGLRMFWTPYLCLNCRRVHNF